MNSIRILLLIFLGLGCFVGWGATEAASHSINGQLTIDLFFILDKSMTSNYNETQASQFLQTILTTAAPYFEKTSLGEAISLKMAGSRRVPEMDAQEFVRITDNANNGSLFSLNSDTLKHEEEGDDEGVEDSPDHDHEHHNHHHVHIVLTTKEISWTGSRFSKQKGISNFQYICDKNMSFVLMQDFYNNRTGLLLVHHLGHLLGLPHGEAEPCAPVTGSTWRDDHDPEHADDHVGEIDLELYGGQHHHHDHSRDSTTEIPVANRTRNFWPLCTKKVLKTIFSSNNDNVSCLIHSSAEQHGVESKSGAIEISVLLYRLTLFVVILGPFLKF